MCNCINKSAFKEEEKIKKAIEILRQKYGVSGLDNKYMLATDIDGDLRIAPYGITDDILWKMGVVNASNFIKIKELG